ncbi:MAG: hypothetical protein PWQ87_290 [Candidatus Woesearchaeota archaeon]|nr:hypothetical protein [Candidatus Woesearchaeota archaeon]
MYEIIIGRSESDIKKYGKKGTAFIGKQYVKMGNVSSLSNNIYLDLASPHVILISGKRGSGKSYTMGSITEGIINVEEEVRNNLSVVIMDTMGIYWTMKYPNKNDKELLKEWGIEEKGFKEAKVFIPEGYYEKFKKKGIDADVPFSIIPSELSPSDWCNAFNIKQTTTVGAVIEKAIFDLKKKKERFSIDEIIEHIKSDKEIPEEAKLSAINRFNSAKTWGLFSMNGTPLASIVYRGGVSIIDLSCYVTMQGSKSVKSLVIGIIAQRLFQERMESRRIEEFEELKSSMEYFSSFDVKEKKEKPLVWMIIDEAHEFLPKEGKTPASEALITLLREGRQPGISMVLATQQPGKIHTDVMTQSDIFISHRLTAEVDLKALGLMMQSYMRQGLDEQVSNVPKTKGAALVFDDYNERMLPIQIRPRITWHGGSSPNAIPKKKGI